MKYALTVELPLPPTGRLVTEAASEAEARSKAIEWAYRHARVKVVEVNGKPVPYNQQTVNANATT